MQARYSGRSRAMARSMALPSSRASTAWRGDSPGSPSCRALAARAWSLAPVSLDGLSFAAMTPSPAVEVAVARGGDAKRSYVRSMFTAIAPRYDFLNHLLSLNVDRRWRRAAVARLSWETRADGVYLDLCAGTLDLAAALARAPGFRGTVVGADFVVPMLVRGRGKAAATRAVAADALTLPFAAAQFDGAMVACGVRNLADLAAGL